MRTQGGAGGCNLGTSWHPNCAAAGGLQDESTQPLEPSLTDTNDVAQLLCAAAAQDAADCMFGIAPLCPQHAPMLRATSALDSESVIQLLHAAVGQRNHVFVDKLISLLPSCCQQMPADAVSQLLLAAVKQGADRCIETMLQLPAAQLLSSNAVQQLLQAAVQQGSPGCVEQLCQLPAAQQFSSAAVQQLLQAAVQEGSAESVEFLCWFPDAAQQLSSHSVQQLLLLAAEQDSAVCMEQLCQLPAVRGLSTDEVQLLLQQCSAECGAQLLTSIPAELAWCWKLAQLQGAAGSNDADSISDAGGSEESCSRTSG
uniref:Uncharacterized protein n=1 Tax=Tetradesmus obliquus TaxID=3088 RepID=A0A383VUE5_TETOB|eukprot:jgi/Sobl393_1/10559/SZX69115.1